MESRLRVVTMPNTNSSRDRAWAAYCPERPDIPWQYAATEEEARKKVWELIQ